MEAGKEGMMSHIHVLYIDTMSVGSMNVCDRRLAYCRTSVQARKWLGRFNHLVVFVIVG